MTSTSQERTVPGSAAQGPPDSFDALDVPGGLKPLLTIIGDEQPKLCFGIPSVTGKEAIALYTNYDLYKKHALRQVFCW